MGLPLLDTNILSERLVSALWYTRSARQGHPAEAYEDDKTGPLTIGLLEHKLCWHPHLPKLKTCRRVQDLDIACIGSDDSKHRLQQAKHLIESSTTVTHRCAPDLSLSHVSSSCEHTEDQRDIACPLEEASVSKGASQSTTAHVLSFFASRDNRIISLTDTDIMSLFFDHGCPRQGNC